MERARLYLQRCPPAISGQHGHDATFRVACVLVHGFDLRTDEALGLLREWNQRCNPPWEEADLAYKVKSAQTASAKNPKGYLLQGKGGGGGAAVGHAQVAAHTDTVQAASVARPGKAAFAPEILKRVAALTPNVDEAFVKERSPLCPETQTPASFLQQLYEPGESVILFDELRSQGVLVCECVEPPYDAGCLDHLTNGCKAGVLFLCNPVDGDYHPNPRLGGRRSRRSEESVTAWRYMVLESDEADARDWLAALVQMPLRIAAIYTSGGRSIHALVRVDAVSKADWDAKALELKPLLTILGADPAAITAVRLTRLPGCYRGQEGPPAPKEPPVRKRWVDEPLTFDEAGDPIWTPSAQGDEAPANQWTGGRLQELLYLNPKPDLEPIFKKVTRREMHEKWLASFKR